MPVSTVRAAWHGDIPGGSGTFTAGDTIAGAVTCKSGFEVGAGSDPGQPVGAAHATCFSRALAAALAGARFTRASMETDAPVTLRPIDGIPAITGIAPVPTGRVPGLGEAGFLEFAQAAKTNCPVSRALGGEPEVGLRATPAGE